MRGALRGAFAIALVSVSIVSAAAAPLALQIVRAEVWFDQRTGEPIITFAFDEASKRLFADYTGQNVGKAMEFRVDGRAVMKPVIREPILGGTGQIIGGFTVEQAREIAGRLSSGSAKFEVEVSAD